MQASQEYRWVVLLTFFFFKETFPSIDLNQNLKAYKQTFFRRATSNHKLFSKNITKQVLLVDLINLVNRWYSFCSNSDKMKYFDSPIQMKDEPCKSTLTGEEKSLPPWTSMSQKLSPGPLSALLPSSKLTDWSQNLPRPQRTPLSCRLSSGFSCGERAGAQVWVKGASTTAVDWEDLFFLSVASRARVNRRRA